MTAKNEENLMQADQARKEAIKEKKRRPFPTGIFIFPLIILFFALISFGLYAYLDRETEISRAQEFENAKKEFENNTPPPPNVVEGRKFYFIWHEELYEYDIDQLKSKLISTEISDFKRTKGFSDTLFSKSLNPIVTKTEEGIINGIYLFNFNSSSIFSKLEISPGAGENAFDYDEISKTLYQYILGDGIYSINLETNEVKNIVKVEGEKNIDNAGTTDEVSISLSPDKKSLLLVNTYSDSEAEEYTSIKVYDLDGKTIDSFDGTFARWLDGTRIIYYPYEQTDPKVLIRNILSKTEVKILESLSNVISISSDPDQNLASISAINKSESKIETYIYDNSTGADSKLNVSIYKPYFIYDNFISGFKSQVSCVDDTQCSITISGVEIYDIKTKKEELIIGN